MKRNLNKNLLFSVELLRLMVLGVGIGAMGYFWVYMEYFANTEVEVVEKIDFYAKEEEKHGEYVSEISGEWTDVNESNMPVYCVQIPNGLDGARPQAGMLEAKVVFEAIAEYGITRFAAIFQNASASTGTIGPIRSLRSYYLEWDTPFDCTIVHAGGSGDALANLKIYGHKDLTENYSYMWRGMNTGRLWNNLFTNTGYFDQFATDSGYTSSNPKGFARIKAEEAERTRLGSLAKNPLKIDKATDGATKDLTVTVPEMHFNLGSYDAFNPKFVYNAEKNSYDRYYMDGNAHEVYDCQTGGEEITPELTCGETKILSPRVVVAMFVEEHKAADNYHEDISSTGSGRAVVFQNGGAIEGTWSKPTRDDQIKFVDASGAEIALMPGQTWIVATPNYGGVAY